MPRNERAPEGGTKEPQFKLTGLKRVLSWITGQTADEIGRLKEGGVSIVEGEARMRHAEANLKEADAKARLAEGAKLFAEAEAQRIENERARWTLGTGATDEESVERLERFADAAERAEAAIRAIRMAGGSVAFDADQVQRLLIGEARKEEANETSAETSSSSSTEQKG